MSPPRHVVVIGGGFAGLSCAVALADRGLRVTVLEARRTLGGRAGSFVDEATGEVVDNGQHLFMGCYRETLKFLRAVGTDGLVRFQKRLTVDYLRGEFRARLQCPPLPAPWHLLSGVLTLKGLHLRDRISLLRAAPALRRLRAPSAVAALEGISVSRWLDRMGQTEGLRRWLWHPLAIATLNQSPETAPASLLAAVLREGFLSRADDSRLGLATVGLGDLYADPARRHIEARGGAVRCGTPVVGLALSGDKIEGAITREGESIAADAFVSAVAPAALARLGVMGLPSERYDLFSSSPILSVNLWFERPVSEIAPFDFAAVIGGRAQWLFNKERILGGHAGHLSAVISAAGDLAERTNEEIARMVIEDVRACLPVARGVGVARSMVVRERSATFAASVQTEPLRPGPRTPYGNLLLAGDWTERGMPATIETAVRAGHRCADLITR
jgi:squalene-associated FAD-dependent desaturase